MAEHDRGEGQPPPPSVPPPAGWYADPFGGDRPRWWNGTSWEQADASWVEQAERQEQRRPWYRFKALWFIVGGCTVLLSIDWILGLASSPYTFPLLSLSGLVLVAVVWWMDRIEPEPLDAMVLCLLWGAAVATTGASLVNSEVSADYGRTAAAVLSAPIVEEALKGVLLIALVRRRMIDSMVDGAVYAVAIAVGFTLSEDLFYYDRAASFGNDVLLETYLVRGVLGLLGHPLFTIWMGVAAGYIVTARPPRWRAWAIGAGSYLVAVALHATANGVATLGRDEPLMNWIGGAVFFVLLTATIMLVSGLRRAQAASFDAQLPALSDLLGMRADELAVFSSTAGYLAFRRSLPRDRRADVGRLWWTLHAIASLRTVVPRSEDEMRRDCDELGELRREADELRRYLFPDPFRRGVPGPASGTGPP